MKTKFWIVLIALLLMVSVGLSLWLMLPGEDAAYAEVWSEGKLLYTLDLRINREVTITTQKGSNTVTVKGGKIAVTVADCPDHYCMDRGYCAGGSQIVCLPNRLVVKFVAEMEIDAVVS